VASFDALDQIRDRLQREHPGWQVWYVPHAGRGVTWCARPNPLINAPSPEDLAGQISSAHADGAWPALSPR
jgi:hypothetical protein